MADQYFPSSAAEKAHFDGLWHAAHHGADPSADLSGADAVGFFRASNVDKGILKSIWSLCTPGATMNLSQFYTALRYIQLAQAGELPISREKLLSTLKTSFSPPYFTGIAIPPPSAPLPNYAITPEDHTKYHTLFMQYDVDRDGLIQSNEAVPIFEKSGLDHATLAAIWSMADQDHDSCLTPKEFCLAFHLIVCVGKKKLPVPATLPPVLLGFYQNAPAVPASHASAGSHLPPAPAPVVHVAAAVAQSSPTPARPVSARMPAPDLMDLKPTTPSPPSAMGGSGANLSVDEQLELESSVRGVAEVAKKAVSSQERAVDSTDKAGSTLKYILQKMSAERVALSSSLSLVEDDLAKAQGRLQSAVHEVHQLHGLVEELTVALAEKRGTLQQTEKQTQSVETERAELLRSIESMRVQLDQSLESNRVLAARVLAHTAEQSASSAALAKDTAHAAHLQQDVAASAAEVAALRLLLGQLSSTHALAVDSSRAMAGQASAVKMDADYLKADAAVAHARVQALEKEQRALHEEKAALLSVKPVEHVAPAVTVVTPKAPITPAAPIPVPVVVAVPPPPVAEDVEEDDKFDDGDTGVEDFPAASPVAAYEKFGDDDFPAPAAAAVDDGFGDFDSFPAPAATSTFGADPFNDAFPAPVAGAVDDGFGDFGGSFPSASVAPDAADGFGGFPPLPAGASTRAISVTSDDEFPPPSKEFSSIGDFDGEPGFVEESFASATKDSPW